MKKPVKKACIFVIAAVLMANAVFANFGQTAGVLDFGKMKPGETKTLSYTLINADGIETLFQITRTGDVITTPSSGSIGPNSQQVINVTAVASEPGVYSGEIRALANQGASGNVVLQIEMLKNYKYEVIPQEESVALETVGSQPDQNNGWFWAIAIFIFSVFVVIFAYIEVSGKWKKQK